MGRPANKTSLSCAYCGKPAQKEVTRIFNPHKGLSASNENWRYQGDHIVIHESWVDPEKWGSNKKKFLSDVTVWDGESWKLKYGNFCTTDCAIRFANAAFRAGHRIVADKD